MIPHKLPYKINKRKFHSLMWLRLKRHNRTIISNKNPHRQHSQFKNRNVCRKIRRIFQSKLITIKIYSQVSHHMFSKSMEMLGF